MAKIGPRLKYTKEKVRELRKNRKEKVSKVEGISTYQYQNILGELVAGGHMQIIGFESMKIDKEELGNSTNEKEKIRKTSNSVSFTNHQVKDRGDAPHIKGYLESASDLDKQYRLFGWFNDDGTIRLELVK